MFCHLKYKPAISFSNSFSGGQKITPAYYNRGICFTTTN